ncbi:uncharacterized, partial [Tachysurus ichikawai]
NEWVAIAELSVVWTAYSCTLHVTAVQHVNQVLGKHQLGLVK